MFNSQQLLILICALLSYMYKTFFFLLLCLVPFSIYFSIFSFISFIFLFFPFFSFFFLFFLFFLGAIGSIFMIMLFLTLYTQKIPRQFHLVALFAIGMFVVVLCFETGCHGDNTYFVMFACGVYLLMGLPVYGRILILTLVALTYLLAGLILERLSPAGVSDLLIILFSLILMAFPQLQQHHYERLNHTQSIGAFFLFLFLFLFLTAHNFFDAS